MVGAPAGEFWVSEDRCSGAGPGRCPVWVAFRPAEVPLQGFAYGGVTSLDMVSDNESIGRGKTWPAWQGAERAHLRGGRDGGGRFVQARQLCAP